MEPGGVVAAAGVLAGVAIAFGLRTRWPAGVVAGALALCGAALSWGSLVVLDGSAVEHAVLIPLMAFLVPFHVRVVLGPLGRPGP